MILMRLATIEGKYTEVYGGSKISSKYGYDNAGMGWFPVESIGFGFQAEAEASAGKTAGGTAGSGGAARSGGASGGRPAAAPSGGAAEKQDAFSQLQVSRFVDRATPRVMLQAMQDRNIKKGEKDDMYAADIHFFHSVRGSAASGTDDIYIYPYLLITLDLCLIRGWNISATGDDRPTESFELYFDKAALMYHRTDDGRTWAAVEKGGWDQTKNDMWEQPEATAKYWVSPH